MSKKHQWAYRPTQEEHELLLRAMASNPEFTSIAQVIRESVLRFILEDDQSQLFSEVSDLIEDLKGTKDRFLTLVLKHSE